MATINLGRVGFVNKGAHNIATAYKVNDVVTYNSGTYACIQAHTGQLPTATAYWQNWVANDKALDSAVVHKTGDETIYGNKNFNNKVLISSSDGILGYASGTGAQVTQGSSLGKGTPMVLDKPSGSVIMNNAALASQANVYFTINNNKFLASDGVVITQSDGGAYIGANYGIWVVYKQDGVMGLVVKNLSPSTLSDAVRFRFDLIRGANS